MKKKTLVASFGLMVSSLTFAGGLLTNTNQNVTFLRNPARDAVIGIDGVYSNPAGVAFLPDGLHLSLNFQSAYQTREVTSVFGPFAYGAGNRGESSKLFKGTVRKEDRSLMNVPFVTGDKDLDAKFVAEAKAAGFENLKGHRTVGGMRASIYNAMPKEGVEKLVEFMKKFEEENA